MEVEMESIISEKLCKIEEESPKDYEIIKEIINTLDKQNLEKRYITSNYDD